MALRHVLYESLQRHPVVELYWLTRQCSPFLFGKNPENWDESLMLCGRDPSQKENTRQELDASSWANDLELVRF